MLTAALITVRHGALDVLRDVSLTVAPRARIGVIGPNGIGKSTLLRVLAGGRVPDSGTVARAPATLEVGLLPQEPDAAPGETLAAYLARRTGIAGAEAALDALTARLAHEPGAVGAYTEALDRFLVLGGADHAARAEAVVRQVGLDPAALELPVAALSGGNAARGGLAALLLARFDVFLLDEPTNNLDFTGLELLERFVTTTDAGVVAVSHDRAFLARCVDTVLELQPGTRDAAVYHGGWEAYLAARAAARTHARAAYQGYMTERARLLGASARERAWAQAGASKARKDLSQKDKIGRRAAIESAESVSGKAGGAGRRLERLDATARVEKPFEPWELRLTLDAAGRGGDIALRLEDAVIERGAWRLGPVSLEVGARERVTLTGANGAGKTSLLHAALGRLPLAAGTRYVGPGQRVGELDQLRDALTGHEPLVAAFRVRAGLGEADARSALAKFGLEAGDVTRPADSLSPGERTRALLALLAVTQITCLVLDEPTNHLDLEAIEQLESALEGFDGTLVVVSHDRAFLEALRITRKVDVGALARAAAG